MNTENTIPTLLADRVQLRPFALSDAKEVQRQAGDPRVAATTATIPHPYPDGAAEAWISKHADWFKDGTAADWAIELIAERKLIGCVSLGINKNHQRAELGYWIGVDFWHQGHCTEAARKAVEYAFQNLNLNKITARHVAQNPSSGRVMEKIGMEKEGYLKEDFLKDGRFSDMVVYGLLKENFIYR